jgi:hypothetical protein
VATTLVEVRATIKAHVETKATILVKLTTTIAKALVVQ